MPQNVKSRGIQIQESILNTLKHQMNIIPVPCLVYLYPHY